MLIPIAIAAAALTGIAVALSRRKSPSQQEQPKPGAIPQLGRKPTYPGERYDVAAGPTLLTKFIAKTKKAPLPRAEGEHKGKVKIETSKTDLATWQNDGYWVLESPLTLLAQAEQKLGRKIGMTALALATLITSEAGRLPASAKTGIAYAALNTAKRKGIHPLVLLMPDGRFARQGAKYGGHSYASTRQAPTLANLKIAEGVLSGSIPDPTGGAQYFDSPRAQRAALAKGVGGYTKTPEQVAEARKKAGLKMVALSDVPSDHIRFWRPA